MHRIAIIPARGGSKRIPSKNIKLFLGKPIITYSIEVALASGLFDEVMVSTDDDEIARIAIEYGAKVPFMRSHKNADDQATTVDVLLETIQQYEKRGQTFDQCLCLYATAPFTTIAQLERAFQQMDAHDFDAVFPVLPFSFPIKRALSMEGNKVSMLQPEYLMSRSQDLEPAYHDSGQFYLLNIKRLIENKKLWTDNTGAIVLSEMEAHDIDTQEDWRIAEFKFMLTQKHNEQMA